MPFTYNKSESELLPKVAKTFFKERLTELNGAGLVCLSIILFLSIISFSTDDSSFNTASSSEIQNFIGSIGAFVSDLLLHSVGFGCFVPIMTGLIWGFRIINKKKLTHLFIRCLALLIASILYSTALSILDTNLAWPLMTKMGGVFGVMLLEGLTNSLSDINIHLKSTFTGLGCGILAIIIWVTALGIPREEWQSFLKKSLKIILVSIKYLKKIIAIVFYFTEIIAFQVSRLTSYFLGTKERNIYQLSTKNDNEIFKEELDSSINPNRSGIVERKSEKLTPGKKSKIKSQGRLNLGDGVYTLPPLELLCLPKPNHSQETLNEDSLQQNAKFLSSVLQDFGIKGEIVKVRPGPVVTLYELEPAPGTKTSRVIGLSDDIARSMSAVSVRVAVVAGRNVIGIELPNITREMVFLRELLASTDFEKSGAKLPLALGKNISGKPIMADLAKMPHLLIAGTTGSGKSVAMNTMILSLLYQCSPDECKFIMIDPKMLELSVYEGIPHLLTPVVTEPSKAIVALKWVVREMENRYRAMSHLGVRSVAGYNSRILDANKSGEMLMRRVQVGFDNDGKPKYEEQPLPSSAFPFIVVVVDEMADLMLVAGKDVEAAIQRLAQMARAAGIHIIMATQRPSVDVITGTVKANFPTRISFQVTSKIDSRTILGEQGAEQLLGQGDMLHMAGGGRISRVHGPFVSDEEVEEIVAHLKAQKTPDYIDEITREETFEDKDELLKASTDTLYDEAVALVAREGKASTSFIQRHLQIGYNRAARIIEAMEKDNVVSAANRVGRREVLINDH